MLPSIGSDTLLLAAAYWLYNSKETLQLILYYFLSLFGISHYKIQGDKENTLRVIKRLQRDVVFIPSNVVYKGAKYITGLVVTKQCIGYINNNDGWIDSWSIHLTGQTAYIQSLLEEEAHTLVTDTLDSDEEAPIIQAPVSITVFTRLGQYREFYYKRLKLNLTDLMPKGDQADVTKQILELYAAKKRCTVFLSGPPATGKSSVGYLVAKELKGAFCHSFNPTDPGDNIYGLLTETRADDPEKPIVIVLEETNMMIRTIHEGKVPINEKVPTSVRDKTSWSNFLDDMVFYKNVVLILTSNETKEEIDTIDSAYLRKGRVDAVIQMSQSVL
jgi:hypothetical protein